MTNKEIEELAGHRQVPAWVVKLVADAVAATKKEWAGLTDEERNACLVEADPCEALLEHEAWQLMVDIEAKLKDKNA